MKTKARVWSYEEKEVRDDVKLALPDDWKLRVFKVTSGDTGNEYFTQVLAPKDPRSEKIYLCDCHDAKYKLPLVVLGLYKCKHAEYLIPFLKEKVK